MNGDLDNMIRNTRTKRMLEQVTRQPVAVVSWRYMFMKNVDASCEHFIVRSDEVTPTATEGIYYVNTRKNGSSAYLLFSADNRSSLVEQGREYLRHTKVLNRLNRTVACQTELEQIERATSLTSLFNFCDAVNDATIQTEHPQSMGPSTSSSEQNAINDGSIPVDGIISNTPEEGNVTDDHPQEETQQSSEGIVPTQKKKNPEKLHRPKKIHFCKFCKKTKSNFVRHVITVHDQEEEVMKYKSSKDPAIMRRIKGDGAAMYNRSHPDMPITLRNTKSSIDLRDQCPTCNILVSSKYLMKHVRNCAPQLSQEKTAPAIRRTVIQNQLTQKVNLDPHLRNEILPGIRKLEVRNLCIQDPTLIIYGNSECIRLRGERRDKAIRQNIRIVANVFLEMQKIDDTLIYLQDIFKPRKYDIFEKAMQMMCGAGKWEGGEYSVPSAPHQYGPKVKIASDLLLTHLMKKQNFDDADVLSLEAQISNVQAWQEVYKRSFDRQVASLGRKQYERRTGEKRCEVPKLEDVQLLIQFVHATASKFSRKVTEEPFSMNSYNELTKALLLKCIIFNRKRVGEVDKVEVTDWLNAQEVTEDSAEFHALTPSEQKFASSFLRLSVLGKTRKRVPLLVSKSDATSINKILDLRRAADIPSSNQFLFAKGCSRYDGSKVMSEFAMKCGAKQPSLLTGRRLRRHMAACLRSLSFDDEDLRLMSELMGHTDKTHLLNYRRNELSLHAGRGAKFLVALDRGDIFHYRGKTLDEITPELELDEEDDESVALADEEDPLPSAGPVQPIDSPQPCSSRTPQLSYRRLISSPSSGEIESPRPKHRGTPAKIKRSRRRLMSSSSSSYSEDLTERRYTSRNAKRPRIRWDHESKAQVCRLFRSQVRQGTLPSAEAARKAIEVLRRKNPLFKDETPKKLKTMVRNLHKEYKKGVSYD